LAAHGTTVDGKPWGVLLRTHGLTDGYVVDNKFLPGQTTGWHSHPGPSIVYVVAGSITNYESSQRHCAGVTYAAGSQFVDAGGTDVHMLRNNGSVPAETIAVQFVPDGLQRRMDKPEPSKCTV
jgi:quercetin dioxygenase-like cupin family protein